MGGLADLTGELFPAEVVFRVPIDARDGIDPGMRGLLIGAERQTVQGQDHVKLLFWMGDHTDFNRKMVRNPDKPRTGGSGYGDWSNARYSVLAPAQHRCATFLASVTE
jgi:hypothetical protein